ncbi:hypothetical protein V6N11_014829 [Hibiscus sabdariffa]|uniref:Protein kinase domain-containing protein n=1 Tax=Hibiscus sabdariffa TaxID=183260 RepID=A0ABR2TQ77_9ROSI
MGCCPCFGWPKGKKLKSDDKKEHSRKGKPSSGQFSFMQFLLCLDLRSMCFVKSLDLLNISWDCLSFETGVDSVGSESIAGLRREASAATDEPNDGNRAHTFNYQQLANATRDFSKESLIGQGGFGAVYKGLLESTGQVHSSCLQHSPCFLISILITCTMVISRIMGTHGYCAPEYLNSGKLTMKSDIFSFGVVLLELITGRKALDDSRAREERFLADWARPMLRDGINVFNLADPLLRGHFSKSTMKKALEVAFLCIQENANCRPSISDIVLTLDYLTSHPYRAHEAAKRVSIKGPDNESPKETTRMLDRDFNRERAVAEAKMWGESWRDKRLQSAENASDASIG